ncbi:MAG: hypothetical protein J7641_06470 [Cyanobacteria bacterium SID2]|nr:hypothetical protein [Cyanobacteria bacterium SID2]MBP0003368.1 hypothetical protein [Cyanobacteria bacterium SBC]
MNSVLSDLPRPECHTNTHPHKTMEIAKCQEVIYRFVLTLVQKYSPERTLEEFQYLFFEYRETPINAKALKSLFEIVFKKDQQSFKEMLKRCCYILVNNWEAERHVNDILKLVQSFQSIQLERTSSLIVRSRLNAWLKEFIESQDYQDLEFLVSKYKKAEESSPQQQHWSERYTSYLLVLQYANPDNPKEQQEIARSISYQLKCQFKFDLAMYIARSQLSSCPEERSKNPTTMGDSVINLLKTIVANWDKFGYTRLAKKFLNACQYFNFGQFKTALLKYVTLYGWTPNVQNSLKKKLSFHLDRLCWLDADRKLENSMVLRTCNRTIDLLTTTNEKNPSELFILLASQGSLLTLVITLARLMLICPHARLHLENRVAQLIQYYMECTAEDCQWVVDFFELFNIVFTLYIDGDTQYSLLHAPKGSHPYRNRESLKNYRIFVQHRPDLNFQTILQLQDNSSARTSIDEMH